MSLHDVPADRIRTLNTTAERPDGAYVLYWMIANRRLEWNFSLDRALEHAQRLHKPLLVLEALRCDYPWASDRLHTFVLQGMRDNLRRAASVSQGLTYYPWIERVRGEGKGLLESLAAHACCVVTDDFPSFFLPRMVEATAHRMTVRMEAIDSNGLLPMRATEKVFPTAHAFRHHLHRELPARLDLMPRRNPFARRTLPGLPALPSDVAARWRPLSAEELEDIPALVRSLPLDHSVSATDVRGGADAARRRLTRFLSNHLSAYATEGNHPDLDNRSGLSPYLHFGHLSAHECLDRLGSHESWTPMDVARKPTGRREGWWGMSASAESWLDELVTWREVGYNMAALHGGSTEFASLPAWALASLRAHTRDRREFVYRLDEFADCRTHDELWNAAQRQLRTEGRIHSYLRMLWGKKILEWTPGPDVALDVMVELNNRYALDGRNPNSYSGIFWTLGRYDRPWFPERPVFGTIRYMSSDNTRRKLRVREYLVRYGAQASLL